MAGQAVAVAEGAVLAEEECTLHEVEEGRNL